MPVRPRRQRRHRVALTARRMLALTIGPSPLGDEPDAVLRPVYVEHRERLLSDQRPGSRPWGWWCFEPGVPEALRGDRPGLHPVGGAVDRSREREGLKARRTAWLAGQRSEETTLL